MAEWVEWSGGGNTLPAAGSYTMVRHRNGQTSVVTARARPYIWLGYECCNEDIVAFKMGANDLPTTLGGSSFDVGYK